MTKHHAKSEVLAFLSESFDGEREELDLERRLPKAPHQHFFRLVRPLPRLCEKIPLRDNRTPAPDAILRLEP